MTMMGDRSGRKNWSMYGEFGEVTVIIGLVIPFLAFVSPLCAFRDTST